MTDRINSFTVVLEKDIREDDVTHIMIALGMVKGVLSVRQNVAGITDHVARTRVADEFRQKLYDLIEDIVP